jgi:hypothetical protein
MSMPTDQQLFEALLIITAVIGIFLLLICHPKIVEKIQSFLPSFSDNRDTILETTFLERTPDSDSILIFTTDYNPADSKKKLELVKIELLLLICLFSFLVLLISFIYIYVEDFNLNSEQDIFVLITAFLGLLLLILAIYGIIEVEFHRNPSQIKIVVFRLTLIILPLLIIVFIVLLFIGVFPK